jgi:hypothetical protein
MLSANNLSSVAGALRKAAQQAVSAASSVAAVVAEEGSGLLGASKLLRGDYVLGAPLATAGPLDVWAIYAGTCKKPGAATGSLSASVGLRFCRAMLKVECVRAPLQSLMRAPSNAAGAVQKEVSIWILDKKRLQESSKQ